MWFDGLSADAQSWGNHISEVTELIHVDDAYRLDARCRLSFQSAGMCSRWIDIKVTYRHAKHRMFRGSSTNWKANSTKDFLTKNAATWAF